MGFLDMMAPSNPFTSWLDQNRQGLVGGFQGLANASPNDPHALLAGAVNGTVAGSQTDYARNLASNALTLQVQQRNATADWLAQNGHPELAGPVRTGAISGTDAFNVLNKQTVVPPGSSVLDGQGKVTTPGGAGGFYGGDLKSQAWSVVMLANQAGADPALKQDPKFQAAWAIVNEPTMTPQGLMTPKVPDNWGPGAAGPATPTTQVAAPAAGSPAVGAPATSPNDAPSGGTPQAWPTFPSAGPQTNFSMLNPTPPPVQGPGVLPGTQPFNESQARVTALTQSAIPDVKRAIAGFPSLMNLKDQVLQGADMGTGIGRAAQTPKYKQTRDAVMNGIANVLYFASGANLNAGELQRKVDGYLPAVGDDPQTVVNKLDRFANDVLSMAKQTKDPATVAWTQQAIADIPKIEQQILSGSNQNAAPVVDLGNGITIQQVSP